MIHDPMYCIAYILHEQPDWLYRLKTKGLQHLTQACRQTGIKMHMGRNSHPEGTAYLVHVQKGMGVGWRPRLGHRHEGYTFK